MLIQLFHFTSFVLYNETYSTTLYRFISQFEALWTTQGRSSRSATISDSILTIGGCGEDDCCNNSVVWRQWSHPCCANWDTLVFIALTTDFILAILRCNLAFCSNISLSCICCCSRLISWFLLYRRDAALFWRMARWALCSFFCLTGNFEFLEGNGGRE